MTNKQFNGFIKFVKDMLEEVENEKDKEKKDKKLRRVIDNLQQTLEDQISVKQIKGDGLTPSPP